MTSTRSLLARRWPALAVVSVLALLAWLASRPTAVLVDAATIGRGPLRITVDDDGRTRVVERYTVSAPIAGRLLRTEVEAGDPVRAGETALVRFEPLDPALLDERTLVEARARVDRAGAALGSAEASLAAARAEREYARAQLERVRALAEKGGETPTALERARADERRASASVDGAEFGLAAARHDLALARAALIGTPDEALLALETDGRAQRDLEPEADGTLVLRSPTDGVVLAVHRESAGPVAAGAALVDVGDPTALELVADFLTQEAVRIEPGMAVLVDGWGAPGAPQLAGRVRRVEPSGFTKVSALGVEEQRVDVVVDPVGDDDAWTRLGDGFRVALRVVVWEAEDVLQVPSGALVRDGAEWSVFVVDGGIARARRVELGRTSGIATEVRAGLTAGEAVVLFPSELIVDGARVEVR